MKTGNAIFLPTIILLRLLTFSCVTIAQIERDIIPPDSLQVVVVTTPNWNASGGIIQLFERENVSSSWHLVGKPEKVVIGRKGLGWNHEYARFGLKPIKKEGDKKSPAGLFYLRSIFGYASKSKMGNLKMPYLHATKTLVCVDDVNSAFYNRIVDSSTIEKRNWKSHENMKRHDNLYRLGVVVDHNVFPTRRGKGSCIFLHLWRNSHKPTVGCTAMAPKIMKNLISWLELEKKPILVQLPRAEFEKSNQNWCLPTLIQNKPACQSKVIKDTEGSTGLK